MIDDGRQVDMDASLTTCPTSVSVLRPFDPTWIRLTVTVTRHRGPYETKGLTENKSCTDPSHLPLLRGIPLYSFFSFRPTFDSLSLRLPTSLLLLGRVLSSLFTYCPYLSTLRVYYLSTYLPVRSFLLPSLFLSWYLSSLPFRFPSSPTTEDNV